MVQLEEEDDREEDVIKLRGLGTHLGLSVTKKLTRMLVNTGFPHTLSGLQCLFSFLGMDSWPLETLRIFMIHGRTGKEVAHLTDTISPDSNYEILYYTSRNPVRYFKTILGLFTLFCMTDVSIAACFSSPNQIQGYSVPANNPILYPP